MIFPTVGFKVQPRVKKPYSPAQHRAKSPGFQISPNGRFLEPRLPFGNQPATCNCNHCRPSAYLPNLLGGLPIVALFGDGNRSNARLIRRFRRRAGRNTEVLCSSGRDETTWSLGVVTACHIRAARRVQALPDKEHPCSPLAQTLISHHGFDVVRRERLFFVHSLPNTRPDLSSHALPASLCRWP